ncbi:MAG: leucyl aminopeptidase [Chloroflexi bacterium]|nr:leucyl aminopeptidase [Chloroflexota bacterium]MBT7081243.1 leucyl aminopeptidase [Chloroflexota bacterium]MBT7288922.1 leucyl aminopeptidase [Chloroflexota bacterium]
MRIEVTKADILTIETDAIVVYIYEKSDDLDGIVAGADKALDEAISGLIKNGEINGKHGEITMVYTLGKLPSPRLAIVGLGKREELATDKVRNAIADACRTLKKSGAKKLATAVISDSDLKAQDVAQALSEGATLGLYEFGKYITKKPDYPGVDSVSIVVADDKDLKQITSGSQRGVIIADGVCMARDMANEPGNYMTPTDMAEVALNLASDNITVTVFDKDWMQEKGMGGLLGVASGSVQPPKFIVMEYKGGGDKTVGLVGKGLTFDSGGISIKPSDKMQEMKGDMAGGASVIAAMGAIAKLKPKINVTGIVPATENLPSGTAQKPGDVLKTMGGKTVEVINTDAEGRLILADALCYANELKLSPVVDIATLTGACMVALGDVCSGLFTNNQEFADKVIASSKATGEKMWQLPMYDEYREQIKSTVADIKNTGGRWGGATTAAQFLEEFVGGTPWVHLDIAGTMLSDKDKGYLAKGAAGIPVRTLVNLVLSLA